MKKENDGKEKDSRDRDFKELKEQVNDIQEQVTEINSLVRISVKQKFGKKFERLREEVKRRKRMDTPAVERFLGCTKPHALGLMEKLGEQSGFKFINKRMENNQPYLIVYREEDMFNDVLDKIEELFQDNDTVIFSTIMEKFGIGVVEVKELAEEFVDKREGYEIVDGNKIVKSKDSKKKKKDDLENYNSEADSLIC